MILLDIYLFIFLVPSERLIQVDLYEKIKELAAKKNISIRQLEEKLGFANATLRRWNKNKPSVDKIQAVAKFFNVSVDYLLGDEEIEEPQFSPELLEAIDNAEGYSGQPIDDHDKEIIKGLLAGYFAGKNKK